MMRAKNRIVGVFNLPRFLRTKFGRDEWARFIQRGLDVAKTAAVCLTGRAAASSPDSLGIAIEWLTVKQAAAQLGGVSDKLIYKMYHRGELEGAKIGGTVRIRAASAAAYLAEHSNKKPPAAAAVGVIPEPEPASARPKQRSHVRKPDPLRFRFFPS